MKNLKNSLRYSLYLLLVCVIYSCGAQEKRDANKNYHNLGVLLTKCEGYGVVVATGYNEGNTKPNRNFIIIRDARGVCFEYYGAKYNIEAGDTLVIKNNAL